MNKENLLRVADAIEKHEVRGVRFSMADYVDHEPGEKTALDYRGHLCGTAACIGAHAVAVIDRLSAKALYRFNKEHDIRSRAKELLGLDEDETVMLFERGPDGCYAGDFGEFDNVTPVQAVATLRYAAKHGVIDWDAAQREVTK